MRNLIVGANCAIDHLRLCLMIYIMTLKIQMSSYQEKANIGFTD